LPTITSAVIPYLLESVEVLETVGSVAEVNFGSKSFNVAASLSGHFWKRIAGQFQGGAENHALDVSDLVNPEDSVQPELY